MVAMAEGFALVRKYDVVPQVFQDVMVEGEQVAYLINFARLLGGGRFDKRGLTKAIGGAP